MFVFFLPLCPGLALVRSRHSTLLSSLFSTAVQTTRDCHLIATFQFSFSFDSVCVYHLIVVLRFSFSFDSHGYRSVPGGARPKRKKTPHISAAKVISNVGRSARPEGNGNELPARRRINVIPMDSKELVRAEHTVALSFFSAETTVLIYGFHFSSLIDLCDQMDLINLPDFIGLVGELIVLTDCLFWKLI